MKNFLILFFVIYNLCGRGKKRNESCICNQSSFLNLKTLVFNIKLPVGLIVLSGRSFHPNNYFDL